MTSFIRKERNSSDDFSTGIFFFSSLSLDRFNLFSSFSACRIELKRQIQCPSEPCAPLSCRVRKCFRSTMHSTKSDAPGSIYNGPYPNYDNEERLDWWTPGRDYEEKNTMPLTARLDYFMIARHKICMPCIYNTSWLAGLVGWLVGFDLMTVWLAVE